MRNVITPWHRQGVNWDQRLVSYFFSVLLIKSTCAVQRIEKKQSSKSTENFMNRNEKPWRFNWKSNFPIAKRCCGTQSSHLVNSPLHLQQLHSLPGSTRPTWSLWAQLGSKVPREGIISNSLLGGASFHRWPCKSTTGFFSMSKLGTEGCIKRRKSDNLQRIKERYQEFQTSKSFGKKKLSNRTTWKGSRSNSQHIHDLRNPSLCDDLPLPHHLSRWGCSSREPAHQPSRHSASSN